MGAQQSLQAPMIQYKNHDRMGIYRYYQSDDEYLIEVEMKLINQTIYKEWIDHVKNIQISLIGTQLVYLPIKYSYTVTEVCGTGGILKMTFQPWQSFLKQEINNRRKNQHYYTEEEIWFILYSIVKIGMLYETKHRKIGDMHPKNIVVTPRGFIQMLTCDTLPTQLNNYQKIVEDISADVYLAPEEMNKDMMNSGVYTVKEPNLADVFSFGISMLEAITLQNCQYLYIRNPLRISFQKLSSYTAIMRQKYSEMLYQTIVSTIDPSPSNRKSFTELYELLRLHQDNIEDLLPFQLNQNNLFTGHKTFKQQNKQKQFTSKSKLCSATSVTANQSIHSLHRRP